MQLNQLNHQVKLLSLNPPDAKHPGNTRAVASIQYGDSIINDWRVVQPSLPGPMYVAAPARWGENNRRTPIVVLPRKVLHEIEDLILAEYTRQLLAEIDHPENSGKLGVSRG